jgi:hypothetical protein
MQNGWMTVNNTRESMWKEVVVAWFKIASRNISQRTEEAQNNFSHDSPCLGWDLNRVPPKYRKVAGSYPDGVIGFFNWPNPSSRTMALGSAQPLTEMSTRNIPGE